MPFPNRRAALVSLVLSVLPARASADEVRAELELVAPSSCATRDELEARVRRRSERVRFVPPNSGGRRARAELRGVGGGAVRVRLVWWSEEGRELVRELDAPTCADALDALSLVLALALDPSAAGSEDPSPEPASPGPAGGTQATDGGPPSAAGAPPVSAGPERRPRAAPAVDGPAPSGASRAGLELRPSGGVLAGARFGIAPSVLPGAGLFVGVRLAPGFPEHVGLRLSATRSRRDAFSAPGGQAEFELDTFRLELCPVGMQAAFVTLDICVEGELGTLEAAGSDTLDPERHARPYRSLGGSAIAALRPLAPLEVGLGAGLAHPLVRDRFSFNPRTFHEVAPLVGRLELSLGLVLP